MKSVLRQEDGNQFSWIDLCQPTARDLMLVMEQYKLHIKAILDSLDPQHLPKLERWGKRYAYSSNSSCNFGCWIFMLIVSLTSSCGITMPVWLMPQTTIEVIGHMERQDLGFVAMPSHPRFLKA